MPWDIRATTATLSVEVTDTNGFPPDQKTGTTISVVDLTRTFTIAPTGSMFHFYELGSKYEKTSSENIVFADTEGEHWFYYDGGVLTTVYEPTPTQRETIILQNAFISAIYWNATDKQVEVDLQDERHGISMSPETHVYLHLTRGAQWLSGFALGNIISDDTGSLDTHAQFSVEAGTYRDEDITHLGSAISVGTSIPVVYNLGSGADIRTTGISNFAVMTAGTGRLSYNQFTGGAWQLTEVNNNDYVLYHIFGFNGVTTNIVSIMGQNEYTNVSAARAGAQEEIANILTNLPTVEMIPIATVIFQTSDGYSNSVKARIRSTAAGEDYVDWRVTELAQGSAPASHTNLTNLSSDDHSQYVLTTGRTAGVDPPLMLPRLTTTERNLVTPSNGMIIYNTTTNVVEAYENGSWVDV